MGDEKNDGEVEDAILAYLAEHPHAADTLQGIAEWWLMRHQVLTTVTTLERVLRCLTQNGVLEVIGDGDRMRYRLKV